MMKYLVLIQYIFILIFVFIDLNILNNIFSCYNKKLKKKYVFFILSFFIGFIAITYQYSYMYHLETYMEVSRAIFITIEFIVLGGFISLLLSIFYLRLFFKKDNSENMYNSLSKQKIDIQRNSDKTCTRKEFIKYGAFVFPLFSTTIGAKGFIDAYQNPIFKKITLKYENLPSSLNGLKFAQISDLHLGVFITLNNFKEMVEHLKKIELDFLFLTGDIVDDYKLLDKFVNLLSQIKTNYGIYSVPGNNEYYRYIRPVVKAYRKYKLPYFINKSKRIKIKNDYIFIAGLDDSNGVTPNKRKGYLSRSLKKILKNRESEDFSIVLCHRYNVFDSCVKNDVDLTLSGHSHGGQFGFNNRSIFDGIKKDARLWGLYQKGSSKMYVTSGAGHWFPLRLNCPTEIPVFELIPE